jgi:hypothetical protein
MLSVKKSLQFFWDNVHLPLTYPVNSAVKGFRPLRPFFSSISAPVFRISSLSGYLYYQSATTTKDDLVGNFELGADGAGRWSLQVTLTTPPSDQVQGFCVGFAFGYSDDGAGRGYVYAHEHYWQEQGEQFVLAIMGNPDPWIAAHWTDAFWQGAQFSLSRNGAGEDDAKAMLAQKGGFSGIEMLQMASVGGTDSSVKPGAPPQPGIGINFGFGWQLPPNVDNEDV